jgi:cytoskeletal protein CcmA (bactofilin family)
MFKTKSELEAKSPAPAMTPVSTPSPMSAPRAANNLTSNNSVSVFGAGMLIKGSVVCEGAMQVFGRIYGEIHATKLSIGEGAQVEGQIMAEETTIAGHFRGTIHSKSVKLERTAIVEGEIFKNALMIDQDAQFEGMTRRLERSIELPSVAQIIGDAAPIAPANTNTYEPQQV